MGELRLYAIGIDEVRDMFGAHAELAERLRGQGHAALLPAPSHASDRQGLLSRLGPIFRRVPGTPVLDPDDPTPADLERIITGAFVPAERSIATWRVLETLIRENSWGGTGVPLAGDELDSFDFALARGGVNAAAGLRHVLNTPTELPLRLPPGLFVGYHTGEEAEWMAASYRQALPGIEEPGHRDLAYGLANWLDGFPHWTRIAETQGRPAPDLIGFWSAP
ncbi:hypothetical protein GCM10011575_14260 [Microlunatus endophyticus]|uniref:DUF7691 domain-containing protein n=1 Tax=Microlunatus endophyticus TaxID=1716077 RepID=A0A917W2X9_9ACTN|nr:hypothetical protein [Microlunatus endophyticus]GGL57002.1 hypothetical protein GCM10011575_14260 [Microlunatus endophyticus]